MSNITPLIALFSLVACTGTPKESTDDSSTTGDDSTDDSAAVTTYTLRARATLFSTAQEAAPEGSCVTLLNPAAGLEGGTPETFGETTVGPNGEFGFDNVPLWEAPPLIIVDDCQANPPTLFPTGTPVPPPLLENIKPGDVLADVQAAAIPVETFDGLQTALSAAGSTTDIPTDGMMIGFVWDKDHKGIEGATLTGGSTVYYGDTDAADGLFTTGGSPNTKTSSTGLWVIPGAPIGTYGAQAAGRTFPNWTAGAIPRGAMVLIFEAQ